MTCPALRKRQWRSCPATVLIPFLFISTIIIAFWIFMRESLPQDIPVMDPPDASTTTARHVVYSTVPNFFAQSDPSTNDKTFDFLISNFGLISQTYDTDSGLPNSSSQWQRFAHKLLSLNKSAPEGTSYRLLFLGRHGQGYHNVAEAFYGTRAWDCYYSTLNGTKKITWFDAHLTPLGITQAKEVHNFWVKQIEAQKMPTPEAYYSSPLERAIHTAAITFSDLDLPDDRPFQPMVKEQLREGIGIHTCDRRSTRSAMHSAHPDFDVEEDFAEEDPIWLPDLREPGAAQMIRLRDLLDDVVTHDRSTWISMTSHSGTIASILRAVGHRQFNVATGGVIPVLVKVERVDGKRKKVKEIEWQTKPECEDYPVKEGSTTVEESLEALDEFVGETKL